MKKSLYFLFFYIKKFKHNFIHKLASKSQRFVNMFVFKIYIWKTPHKSDIANIEYHSEEIFHILYENMNSIYFYVFWIFYLRYNHACYIHKYKIRKLYIEFVVLYRFRSNGLNIVFLIYRKTILKNVKNNFFLVEWLWLLYLLKGCSTLSNFIWGSNFFRIQRIKIVSIYSLFSILKFWETDKIRLKIFIFYS